MSINPNIKFTQVRKGYDPQEVDTVFDEFQKQIKEHKEQIRDLNHTIEQYENKTALWDKNTKQIEDERIKESLRLTGLMNNAAQMAEQIEQAAQREAQEIIETAHQESKKMKETTRQESERIRFQVQENKEAAQREAERIINAAQKEAEILRDQVQTEFMAARAMLAKFSEHTKKIRQSHEQYVIGANAQFIEIDKLIRDALSSTTDASPDYIPLPPSEFAPPRMSTTIMQPLTFVGTPQTEQAASDVKE